MDKSPLDTSAAPARIREALARNAEEREYLLALLKSVEGRGAGPAAPETPARVAGPAPPTLRTGG